MSAAGDAPALLANRVLEQEAWARDRLAAFAGRVFTVSVGPLTSGMRIDERGMLETAATSIPPDLTLRLSPLAMPSFLAQPQRWNEFVEEHGDADLGGALKDLAQTLPWFVEQAFAKALGPLAGQRAADAGRALLAFPEYAAQRVTDSVASYARDEAGLFARADAMRRHADGVQAVEAAVAALEARIEALAKRAGR
jgi:ubiquinone biosynthesis accessory factor UbiJ